MLSWDKINKYRLSLAVCIHKFLELGCSLDLEEDFLAVLGLDFQVQLFSSGGWFGHDRLLKRCYQRGS
jgi:hypothetical protein